MHHNEGDDDDGYDDHNGDDDDDEARSGRGLRDPWIDRWIGETHETQSWLVNYTFTVTRDPLTL